MSNVVEEIIAMTLHAVQQDNYNRGGDALRTKSREARAACLTKVRAMQTGGISATYEMWWEAMVAVGNDIYHAAAKRPDALIIGGVEHHKT